MNTMPNAQSIVVVFHSQRAGGGLADDDRIMKY
jgi:hypothetical protein